MKIERTRSPDRRPKSGRTCQPKTNNDSETRERERGGGGGEGGGRGGRGREGWRRDRQTDRQTDADIQTETHRERVMRGGSNGRALGVSFFYFKLDNLTIEKLQPPITVTAFDQLSRGGGGVAGRERPVLS